MKIKECHFLDETLAILERCQETRAEIARGAEVDYGWLAQVADGTIKNPGIRPLWRLRCYLLTSPIRSSKIRRPIKEAPDKQDVCHGA